MNTFVKNAPGTFDFVTTSTSGRYDLGARIPAQTISRISFRAEFDSAAEALTCKKINMYASFLSSNHAITSERQISAISFDLDYSVVTKEYSTNIPVYLTNEIENVFYYTLYNHDFTGPPEGLTHLSVTFAFDKSTDL